ncbi:unnamed protein product [Clonostachys rosea]|uniref:Ubiquitin-like domain-containing protein n=1 Tax=Bionectria ochroleuca TaxID=29856 RepID=A0ABY6UEY4_BIOOC|nr:unnamed protein product [Clonostachys rosea]
MVMTLEASRRADFAISEYGRPSRNSSVHIVFIGMASAITFGGLGDILTVCKIGNNLIRALSDKSGSRRRYLDFCDEVHCLVQVLTQVPEHITPAFEYKCLIMVPLQVVVIFEEREGSPFLDQLFTIVKPIIDECGSVMQEELMRIQDRYHDSLRPGGSGSSTKDAFKKLQFGAVESTKLQQTIERLRARAQQLSALVTIAGERATRADAATIRSKLDGFEEFLARIAEKGDDCERRIESQALQLHSINEMTRDIYGQTDGIVTEICEIKHNLDRIIADQHYHASNGIFLNGPDPTFGKPVLFEDSLGTVLELPTEWIHSWQFFQMLLQHHFEELKGYRMVVRRQYALEENITGKDLDESLPPKASFRRGMKINMSMIFTGDQIMQGTDGCGVWFRMSRLMAKTTVDDRQPRPSKDRSTIQEELDERLEVGEQTQEDPADFQRLQLKGIPSTREMFLLFMKLRMNKHNYIVNMRPGIDTYRNLGLLNPATA